MESPTPSYDGTNLANLVAELEVRLTGRSQTRGLRPCLAELIPHTRNYLLLIIDGLGDRQLTHPPQPQPVRTRQHRRCENGDLPTHRAPGHSSEQHGMPRGGTPRILIPTRHPAVGPFRFRRPHPGCCVHDSRRRCCSCLRAAIAGVQHGAFPNRSSMGTLQTLPATRHHTHRISRPRPLRHPPPPMGRSTWTRTSPTVCDAGESAAHSCSPDPSNRYTGSLSGPAPSSSAPNNYTNGSAEDPHTRPSTTSRPRRSWRLRERSSFPNISPAPTSATTAGSHPMSY